MPWLYVHYCFVLEHAITHAPTHCVHFKYCDQKNTSYKLGTILCMGPVNERWCYTISYSLDPYTEWSLKMTWKTPFIPLKWHVTNNLYHVTCDKHKTVCDMWQISTMVSIKMQSLYKNCNHSFILWCHLQSLIWKHVSFCPWFMFKAWHNARSNNQTAIQLAGWGPYLWDHVPSHLWYSLHWSIMYL